MLGVASTLIVSALLFAAPASATLVYQGVHGIVAARNDGSDRRVIAQGYAPQVSPAGHRIAYLVSAVNGDRLYVVGKRGRHRRLLLRRAFDLGPMAPIAWSADERYLAVADPYGGGYLVDVVRPKVTHLGFGVDGWGGASFAPNGAAVTVCHGGDRGEGELTAVGTKSLERRPLGQGCVPVWGRSGLAFRRFDKVYLRKRIGVEAHALLQQPAGTLYPVDGSADGNRLLVFAGRMRTGFRAVAIDLEPRRVTRSATTFSRVTAISNEGREVLGELNGDVVVATISGSPRVLAHRATRPSWSK
jgi:hypothetical protein